MEKNEKQNTNNESEQTIDPKPFHYKHARANIAVDMVVFGIMPENMPNSNELRVFVHRPEGEGDWWLPGRYMHCGKSLDDEQVDDGENWTLEITMQNALKRTWEEEKSIREKNSSNLARHTTNEATKTHKNDIHYIIKPNIDLVCQLEAMSALKRDDRENRRIVSIPYITLVNIRENNLIPSALVPDYARWMPVSQLINIRENYAPGEVKLAHDHFEILRNGVKKLFQEIRTRPIGGNLNMVDDEVIDKYIDKEEDRTDKEKMDEYFLLPTEFDISQLIHIYNVIMNAMGVSVGRSNLRKLLFERGLLKEAINGNHSKKGMVAYQFVTEKYREYKEYLSFSFNPKLKDK